MHHPITYLAILILLVVGGCQSQPFRPLGMAPPIQVAPVAENWLTSVLQTVQIRNEIVGVCGSGSPIACKYVEHEGVWRTWILTAKHVVKSYEVGWVVLYGPDTTLDTLARVWSQHPTEDAALVVVDTKMPRLIVPIAPYKTAPGDQVTAVGYPACARRVITSGYIGEPRSASALVYPGNSGGPVLDRSGEIVGVVRAIGYGVTPSGVAEKIQHDMLFTPTHDLIEWIIQETQQ